MWIGTSSESGPPAEMGSRGFWRLVGMVVKGLSLLLALGFEFGVCMICYDFHIKRR